MKLKHILRDRSLKTSEDNAASHGFPQSHTQGTTALGRLHPHLRSITFAETAAISSSKYQSNKSERARNEGALQ